ncbi:MAG: acetyl/propionyl/methylcrotonyl-CoA carboxylase subunit alpha [Hyphomicrobiales bacterium]|nr:acetyl/propionyl/methylcrotonyl-CoA carboxylase subunit alpha [Hyphomicrobiales bacterium]MCP5002150.1 acetyl/propionyl/methylcrotonyl-CoA carboxylase subunit alpha [Hyphomicrobiales bacterium]
MFKKILIANRGEIACRVFKTAKRMGIATVAVYSEADRTALHVEMADEAVYIGAAAASESYLVIDEIIDACKQTGAEAVHPGYGFLSERAEFADRLAEEGIAFIGPPKGAIEAMGDKITSKKIAADAGVSTVPGVMGLIDDAEHAVKIASGIGYPVMIKASAGGGGKGMRIAWNDDEAREGFERSKSEAASSFGDDRIFIEKFVTEPRHIEIQVLADTKGNCIYLGERECSIQRRNQKVIEEAPSPFLDAETRKAMGEQAVALAKAVDYASAGTVEFIVDKERNFFFLEMNTRLQVEHPVTELITGIDLVEQMIRVAAGEELAIKQADVKLNGWAVESRLYAEDPFRNFLPSIGRLTRYRPPQEGEGADGHIVRNDTGVFEGGEISMFYDPMIAKLCTWAEDRNVAIEKMADALDHFEIEGIGHNIPFLSAVMDHDRFRSGNITTAFIAEEYPDGFHGVEADCQMTADFAAVAVVLDAIEKQRHAKTGDDRFGDAQGGTTVRLDRENVTATFVREGEAYLVTIGDKSPLRLETDWQPGSMLAIVEINEQRVAFKVDRAPGGYRLRHRGVDQTVQVLSDRVAELAALMPEKLPPDTSNMLLCPMPGLVVALHVEEGAQVQEGQALAIVEAMKMENVLRAERSAKVAKIPVGVGDSLAVDEVIMEFET